MKVNFLKIWEKEWSDFKKYKVVLFFSVIHVGEIFLYKLLNLKYGGSCQTYCIPTDWYLYNNFAANTMPPRLVQIFISIAHLPSIQMFCTFSKCVLILQAF